MNPTVDTEHICSAIHQLADAVSELTSTVNACLVGIREAVERQGVPNYTQELLDLTDAVASLAPPLPES